MERFKYLGILIDRSDDDWTAVLRNIRKSRQVRGRIGKLLWREGSDTAVLENFYQAVVQAVLLFGEETWVFMETIMQRLEGAHANFLH